MVLSFPSLTGSFQENLYPKQRFILENYTSCLVLGLAGWSD